MYDYLFNQSLLLFNTKLKGRKPDVLEARAEIYCNLYTPERRMT